MVEMYDFYIKYYSDEEFRAFINEISDLESQLWKEYKMIKTYEFLTLNFNEIKEGLYDVSFLKEPIEEMIAYFLSNEEYEKCNDLKEIKKYLK